MMPLVFADKGKKLQIVQIEGNAETKQHLADLGFTVGGDITVISESGGSLIVSVKESRVALGSDMAVKIMV